jgi:hypothetical protein
LEDAETWHQIQPAEAKNINFKIKNPLICKVKKKLSTCPPMFRNAIAKK